MDNYSLDSIKKDIMMNINLIDGEEYRNTLLAIANISSDILVKTLGPFASTTTIDDGATTYSTKDGWSVLNRLQFGDPVQETLFKFLQRISFTLNSRVGDGTTTAIVAANQFIQIFDAYRKYLASSNRFIRQQDLLNIIDEAKNDIVKALQSPKRKKTITSHEDKGYEDIYKIAYVSSNRNEMISSMIKDLYDKTDNPNIHVAFSDTAVTYADIQRGYKLDTELMFDKFYLDNEDKYLLSSGGLVWIFDHNMKYSEHFQVTQEILTYSASQQKPAIIMAPSFDDTFLSAMQGALLPIVKQGGIPSVILIRIPLSSTALKNYASDFSVLTQTTLFNYTKVRMYNFLKKYSNGGEMEDNEEFNNLFAGEHYSEPVNIVETCAGTINRITITKKSVLLEDFVKDNILYENTLKEIQERYKAAREKYDMHGEVLSTEYMESHLRLIKFVGNTGVIHVGGDSELNKKCTKDAVDDAVLACRSAFENGYIRGLNLETISAACELYTNTEPSIKRDVYGMIAATFCRTSFEVMLNKFRGESYMPEEYEWGSNYTDNVRVLGRDKSEAVPYETSKDFFYNEGKGLAVDGMYKNMLKVIERCVRLNFGYDIVTETYEDAGESVINSVATDIEILNATTSIISLLLSSNQLLSINRRYDKKSGKEYTLNARREDGFAFASGIAEAFKDSGCTLFSSPAFDLKEYTPFVDPSDENLGKPSAECEFCKGCNPEGPYCLSCEDGCWKNTNQE